MPSISLKTSNGSEIPLKNIRLTANVVNHIAQFTLEQTFTNNETNPIEAFYTFPLTATSSVFSFTAQIGDRIIKTVLKEKQEAREEYNKAISEGNGAYLMERINGDVFSVSLGNIQPNSEILITIKYVVELRVEIDYTKLRLNIPLTIMPRYNSFSFMSRDAMYQSRLVNPPTVAERPYTMSISGSVTMPDGIVSLDSKTSKVKLSNMKENSVSFDITDLQNLNEDIIVTVERNSPKSSCMTQKADGFQLTNEMYRYATMVNISPSFKEVPEVNPSEVHYTLLIDSSGSMQGQDIENCKQGAKIFLLSLPAGSSFDVYHFNTMFEKFKPSNFNQSSDNFKAFPEISTVDPKFEAIAWIDKILASGGTELRLALEDVYASIKQTNKRGVIVLLSDGGISDTDAVLKLVKKNKAISVFTIGIGQSVSQDLIQGMADTGNGKAEFVNSGTDQIKEKILAQLKRAQTTLRKASTDNEIKIDVDGPYKLVPETIPTLYENDINTFFVFSQNPVKSVNYVQVLKDFSINTNILCSTLENDSYPLHRMAGIKLIDSLANNPSGSQIEHQKQDPYKSDILSVSLNLGVLSNYTSFIGVEYREEVDKTTQQAVLKEVPLQVAEKYKNMTGVVNNSSYGYSGPCGPVGTRGAVGYCGAVAACASASARPASMATANFSSYGMAAACSSAPASMPMSNNASFGGYSAYSAPMPQSNSNINFSPREESFGGYHDLRFQSKSFAPQCASSSRTPTFLGAVTPSVTNFFASPAQSNTQPKQNYQIVLTINKLPAYRTFSNILTSITPGQLAFASELKPNDYIRVTGEGAAIDGVYKVWNIGSSTESWVIEKVE